MSDEQIHYVVGFCFDQKAQVVATIHKQKGPRDIIGKWNGIGGKIEEGEDPASAMEREFREETGVTVPWFNWRLFATVEGTYFKLYCYRAFTDDVHFVETVEEEPVSLVAPSTIYCFKQAFARNLPILISLALDDSGIITPVHLSERVAA